MRWGSPPTLPSPAETGTILVEARDVEVQIGGRKTLEGVSLEVRAGEVLVLVGPNGAGKSTLLNVLSGDLEVACGSVLLADRPIDAWSDRELAMRRSVLPQGAVVTFPFLVEDIVRMGRAPWSRTSCGENDDEIVADALSRAEVTHLTGRLYTTLSGGERARVAFARLLAQRTGLVLLDEPTAALDIRHQESVMRQVRVLTESGVGAAVVVHDLGLAAAFADRVALLANGRLVALDEPRIVFTPDLLSTIYQHTIEVTDHPRTGELIIQPSRVRTMSRSCSGPVGSAKPG